MSDYTPTDSGSSAQPTDLPAQPTDVPTQPSDMAAQAGDVPGQLMTLPDGSEAVVTGDPIGDAPYNHQQGDNALGFQNDCGLASAADVLNQFGIPASENDVVNFAVQNGLTDTSHSDPSQNGGTTMSDQVTVLTDAGVPAHAETGNTINGLASEIDAGHAVIIGVDSSILWNQPQDTSNGAPDHAITVTGVARDPNSGQILGFYVNDSGDGNSAKFVDAATMQQAWINAGGSDVVTDGTVPGHPSSSDPSQPASTVPGAPAGYTPAQPASTVPGAPAGYAPSSSPGIDPGANPNVIPNSNPTAVPSSDPNATPGTVVPQ